MPEQLDARVLERRAVLERFVAEELRELEAEAARADEPTLRRLREADAHMLHAMSLSEKICRVGGADFLEQPADRGVAPFASAWATPQ